MIANTRITIVSSLVRSDLSIAAMASNNKEFQKVDLEPTTAQCNCGAVKLKLNNPQLTMACHCRKFSQSVYMFYLVHIRFPHAP